MTFRILPPLASPASSGPSDRCKHEVAEPEALLTENLGGGPSVYCRIHTCVECRFSWIQSKTRLDARRGRR